MLAGAVIGHSSKRQPCVASASTEAEIIAASAAALEIAYFRGLLSDLGLTQDEPTLLYVDNQGAIALATDRRSCNRSRHVDRRYFKVRELVALGEINVQYIQSADNPADLLTKPLSAKDHLRHSASLMNILI